MVVFVVVLTLLSVLVSIGSSVDLTLVERATGRTVVDAVVDIISQSCVFDNDRLMLRRIAYAETRDGAASYTFTHGGGIWQVDETTFTETRAGLSRELENGIMTSFSIDWKQTQYHELQKPLYSGIAAMLKILAYYRDNNIPQSPTEQADYWSTLYSTNSHATPGLYNDANAAVDTTCSSPKADIVFVLDGSGSIGNSNFEKVKSFAQLVVGTFQISSATTRVALIEYGDDASVQFDLQQYASERDVKSAIAALPYFAGRTNSAAGLNATTRMIQRQGRHGNGVPVVVIFLTDGKSNEPPETKLEANNLHTTLPEVTVFAVAVGGNIYEEELRTIASEPKCSHVYFLAAFNDITAFTNQIMNGACKAQAELGESRKIKGTLNKDQHYYFKIKAKKSRNGVRVQVSVEAGAVKAYYSWRVQNPSEALHDDMVAVEAGKGSRSVHVDWSEDAERNARSVTITDDRSKQTDTAGGLEATLYGSWDHVT